MPPFPAFDWRRDRIAYYQRLIDRYLANGIAAWDAGSPSPDRQAMRRHEIKRLRALVASTNLKNTELGVSNAISKRIN
jgi:hypothetical protein